MNLFQMRTVFLLGGDYGIDQRKHGVKHHFKEAKKRKMEK
jgi:hypothetical protein